MADPVVNEVEELEPAAKLSAKLHDALMVVSDAVAGSLPAEQALDELVRQLNTHAGLTWNFARWWDYQTGPVNSETAAETTLRWFQVLAAFRAAMEM